MADDAGDANKVRARAQDGNDFQLSAVSAATPGTDTNWHNCIVTYDDSTGTLTIYIDNGGSGAATDASFGAINPGVNMYIGAGDDGLGGQEDFMNGNVAEFEMWDRLLSAPEHAALQTTKPAEITQTSAVILCKMLQGGAGGDYQDYSANALTVTNQGSTDSAAHPFVYLPTRLMAIQPIVQPYPWKREIIGY